MKKTEVMPVVIQLAVRVRALLLNRHGLGFWKDELLPLIFSVSRSNLLPIKCDGRIQI